MKIILGLLRKNIPSVIINNLIFFVSFVFVDISIAIGGQLDSAVGAMIVLIAIAYLLLISITVLIFQVIIDRGIWKSLYKYGLLEEEKRKISVGFDVSFVCVSFPASLIYGNYLITKLMGTGKIWLNCVFLMVEIVAVCIACVVQNYFLSTQYDGEHYPTSYITNENYPLFLKNVSRNKSKLGLVAGIICFGMVVFNSILFILNCDNSQVYVDKAIAVDFFLTGCDTRNTDYREDNQIVKENDIVKVTTMPEFIDGGRLYHSISPIASLKTDLLPEASKFSISYGTPFAQNEDGSYFVNLYGADSFVMENMELYEGDIDLNKMVSGEYIIYGLSRKAGSLAYVDDVSEEWKYFNVGDQITLDGTNGPKKYTIMAICKVNHTYSEQYEYSYPGHELIFYLPTTEYLTYAESADDGEVEPMRYLFNTVDSLNTEKKLDGLSYESRRKWFEEYEKENHEIVRGTFLFAVGCAIIGFFVYVNTMIISYLDRKTEFTTLAKIGMTSRQVYAMIFGEGATCGIVISLIIAVCVGMVEVLGKITLIGESWKYMILVSPLLFCVAGILVVSALVPIVVFSVIRTGDK